LPPAEIGTLVNARGELRHPLVALLRFSFFGPLPKHRRQLEAEIRAQFEAFRRAGLSFDHVNGHNNMQLHPAVLPILMRVCREYGVKAVRVPREPLLASWRASRRRLLVRFFVWLVMWPWATHVRRRLVKGGFVVNDYLFGVVDCGSMDGSLLRRLIENLPDGVTEIHCHPATSRCAAIDKTMASYAHEAELQALVDPGVRAALSAAGAEVISGYGGLNASGGSTR
jgi:hopanoid biosynthesis associated protein HpnK